MNIELKKFNMKQIKDDQVVVLIGKRNTGKSFLTKDLMYGRRNIPIGTVISPTENANKFYSDFIPPIFIHDEYQKQIITNHGLGSNNMSKVIFCIRNEGCLIEKTYIKSYLSYLDLYQIYL